MIILMGQIWINDEQPEDVGRYNMTGWWFGTFFVFPYIGNNHPN